MLRCLTIVHFNFFFVLLISNSAKWVSLEEISAIIRKPSKSVLSSRRDSIELKRTLLETKPTSCLNLAPNRHWKLWSVRETAPTHKKHAVFKQICKTDIFLVAAAAALLNHSACWELLAEEFFWRPKLLAISLRIRENVADPELGVSGFGPDIDSLPPLLGPSRKKISSIFYINTR